LLFAALPEGAVLSSAGSEAELRFQRIGSETLAEAAARFSHVDGSTVVGALLPGRRVVVATATLDANPDPSWASGLVRLEAGKPARVLVDRVNVASRPIVSPDGRVFVARGRAGIEPAPAPSSIAPAPSSVDSLRVDALEVDEVDVETGATRRVHTSMGYLTYLVGLWGRELIIYEVGPGAASLLAVHVDSLGVRRLVPSMAPLAHDFVIDERSARLIYTQGTLGREAWTIEAVSLRSVDVPLPVPVVVQSLNSSSNTTSTSDSNPTSTSTSKPNSSVGGGALSAVAASVATSALSTRLAEGTSPAMLPTLFPDGRLGWARQQGLGLVSSTDGKTLLPAQGAGFERVRFFAEGLAIGMHEMPSDFSQAFAVTLAGSSRKLLLTPKEARLDLAGVVR
jgi:hypothetical protein